MVETIKNDSALINNDELESVIIEIDQEPLDKDKNNYRHEIVFEGDAKEYFNIWIVNIALTILTLGIFSAWAKVRKKRYFHGNTFLDGNSFEYTANPVSILKGRLVAVVLFAIYWVAANFYPMALIPVAIIAVLLLPWVIYRSLRFNALNSIYRGVRFGFDGKYKDAAKAYLFWPALFPFTLGLIWPYVQYKQNLMFVSQSRFGLGGFNFSAKGRDFYNIYFKLFIISLVFGFLAILGVMLMTYLSSVLASPSAEPGLYMVIVSVLTLLPMFIAQIYFYTYLQVRIRNLVFNNAIISNTRFKSTLDVSELFKIYLVNVIAIILSLGLLAPWAAIRVARYKAENTVVISERLLETMKASSAGGGNAMGEEVGDMFDVGVGI